MKLIPALWLPLALLYVSASLAQDAPAYSQFLDFGVPCEDPHDELLGPAMLHANKSSPKSNPATPLTQPPYPALSRRMGEEGTAILKLLVNENGVVSQAHIVDSTGSPRLDNAALEETRNWRLTPGKVDGEPRCMWNKFAVTFMLADYSAEQLQAANVTEEARTLASQMMGLDELRQVLTQDAVGISEIEARMLDLTIGAARNRSEWTSAYDKVAKVFAIEFSPEELKELADFFSRPIASKWRAIGFKMAPTLQKEQRLVADTLMCALSGVKFAMQQELDDFSFDTSELTEAHSLAITKFVEKAIPFCACQRRALSAPGENKALLGRCGLPPKLMEPQR